MSADALPAAAPVSLQPTGAARRQVLVERAVKFVLLLAAGCTVLITASIIYALLRPSIDFFNEVSIVDFLTGKRWAPLFNPPSYGVWPIIAGTFWVAFIAMVVAVPLGLGAAFYMSEYARPGVRKVVKPVLEVLAGIPTVVYGFFALTFINPDLVKRFWPVGEVRTYSALAAGLVTGIMILPTVASLAEDAMSAVPGSLRDGALALGSTRREVCTKVVFPAALSGIVAAIVLGGSRAIGETTIALLAAGSRPELSTNPGLGMQTMAGYIGFAGIGDQPTNSPGYRTLFAVGILLFVITLVLNVASMRIVRRFRQVYE